MFKQLPAVPTQTLSPPVRLRTRSRPASVWPAFKVLVVGCDPGTADAVAASLPEDSAEIIACDDMALAEVAMDTTEFDVVLVAPHSTGVGGAEGFAVMDFVGMLNPAAISVLMVRDADGDLKAAIERRGGMAVMSNPPTETEMAGLWRVLNKTRNVYDAA